jgi:hypothetical protein
MAATATMATTTMATLKSSAVFTAWIVACLAYVALPIPRLVRMEMAERRLSALRHRSRITVARIIAVINVAVEAVRTMEPWASAEEYPANKPIWTIVAIRSAGIRRIVKVPIRTHRRRSNINGDLSRGHGHAAQQHYSGSNESKQLPSKHKFLLNPLRGSS